ncbi:MAG: hypothetical protein Q4D90_03150 [bacterium]|nr:hypothetical protein [bacterium]
MREGRVWFGRKGEKRGEKDLEKEGQNQKIGELFLLSIHGASFKNLIVRSICGRQKENERFGGRRKRCSKWRKCGIIETKKHTCIIEKLEKGV